MGPGREGPPLRLTNLTPILVVEAIETCLPFWEGLGLAKTVEVSHGDRLGFVVLAGGGLELMLQTRASLGEDLPALVPRVSGSCFLYLEVTDLAAIEARLDPATVLVPRRQTFYGAEEIWVREPGGHVIGFSYREE